MTRDSGFLLREGAAERPAATCETIKKNPAKVNQPGLVSMQYRGTPACNSVIASLRPGGNQLVAQCVQFLLALVVFFLHSLDIFGIQFIE